MNREMRRQQRQLTANERGPGDDPPPPRAASQRRTRAIVIQTRTETRPKITKRLIRVNYSPGRPVDVDMLTIHVTEGSAASVVSWFNNADAQASAHYQVRRNGEIDQFVDELDRAWHNGRVSGPTAPLVLERPHTNPNAYAIGIEHEGSGGDELTPEQRAATLWLQREIIRRHPKILVDRRHIVGHHQVYALKTCPGKIDVDRLVRDLQAGPVPVTPAPPSPAPPTPSPAPHDPSTPTRAAPRVVWSKYFDDYLIVVRVVSDNEWYFVRARRLAELAVDRAQTPLSQMPLQP